MTHDENNHEDLPQALIDELKSGDRPVSLITSRVDREIMAQAEQQFAGRRRHVLASYPTWAAVAAAVLVAVFFIRLDAPSYQEPAGAYADLDESGSVDIADVLYLARSNDSGRITQAEIDAFAMSIVSLTPGGEAQ